MTKEWMNERCWVACCISCFFHMPKGSPVKNAHEFGHGFLRRKTLLTCQCQNLRILPFVPMSLAALLSGAPRLWGQIWPDVLCHVEQAALLLPLSVCRGLRALRCRLVTELSHTSTNKTTSGKSAVFIPS